MENSAFYKFNGDERKNKLKQVLKGKENSPSNSDIEKIINTIDLNKQYSIIVTSKPEKFKNIIMSEHIETNNRIIRSHSFCVYGDYKCGHFENVYGLICKTPSDLDFTKSACSVKVYNEYSIENHEKITYSKLFLVVYVPKNKYIS